MIRMERAATMLVSRRKEEGEKRQKAENPGANKNSRANIIKDTDEILGIDHFRMNDQIVCLLYKCSMIHYLQCFFLFSSSSSLFSSLFLFSPPSSFTSSLPSRSPLDPTRHRTFPLDSDSLARE